MSEMPALPPNLDRALQRESTRWWPWYTGVDAADLRQEGLIAWWQVMQHDDPPPGVPRAAYAWMRVLGRVKDVRKQVTTWGRVRYYPLARARARCALQPCREVWLWRRVNLLPGRLRYVLIRQYWSGWSQPQIARRLGVSPSRVHQMQRVALRQLRRMCVLDLLECG